MRLFIIILFLLAWIPELVLSQGSAVTTYYDPELKNVKEEYHVLEGTQELQGPYTSYYINGQVKEQGSFMENQPVGTWEYYYENGNMKMTGEIRDNENYGQWRYFYENGNPSMGISPVLDGKNGVFDPFALTHAITQPGKGGIQRHKLELVDQLPFAKLGQFYLHPLQDLVGYIIDPFERGDLLW